MENSKYTEMLSQILDKISLSEHCCWRWAYHAGCMAADQDERKSPALSELGVTNPESKELLREMLIVLYPP